MRRLFVASLLLWAPPAWAALVEGTNVGFVTVAPTTDPAATALTNSDNEARAGKFTAPADAVKVREIGWWCNNATEAANFEVGLYTDNGAGATSVAVTLLSGVSRTNAKGTTAGWKSSSVDIDITPGTIYWIAFQLDNTATTTETDGQTGGGRRGRDGAGTATLATTWTEAGAADSLVAVYAVYTTSTTTLNDATINAGVLQ